MNCECPDSSGKVCGKGMTTQEFEQDGMCCVCADHVWNEMSTNQSYTWHHGDNDDKETINT